MVHALEYLEAMTRSETRRRIHRRLEASVLLVCLLFGPLRAIAAPWLLEKLGCCSAGMCPAHEHSHEEKKAEPSCDHAKTGTVSDCTVKCGETSKEVTALSPSLPEAILVSSIGISEPAESRAEALTPHNFIRNRVLSPPDRPPRR
jgi:hypothetical protein